MKLENMRDVIMTNLSEGYGDHTLLQNVFETMKHV